MVLSDLVRWRTRRLAPDEMARRVVERAHQRRGERVSLRAHGTSMMPVILDGDEVVVQFSEVPRLRVGMVVYFRRGAHRLAHRLWLKMGPVCIEWGDNHWVPGLVKVSSILGTVELPDDHE